MKNITDKMDVVINDIKSSKYNKQEVFELLDEFFDYDNYIELYQKFIPKIIDYVDGIDLLDYIYDIEEMNDYLVYLFYKGKVNLLYVRDEIYEYILKNTSWGLDYLLANIDIISENKKIDLAKICVNCKKDYKMFIASFKDYNKKLNFIYGLISYLVELDNDDILNSMYVNDGNGKKLIKNDLGHLMVPFAIYKNIIDKLFVELFESEKYHKMLFLKYLNSDNCSSLKEKYKIALRLYSLSCESDKTEMALSNLINFNKYDEFDTMFCKELENNDLKCISLGTETSDIFSIGDNILKIGYSRYNNDIDTNFFRIIPCNLIKIKNEFGDVVSVVEKQKMIDTNPNHISLEMIYELFLDFKRHGKYIADPKALLYNKSNFGLLNSYKDAVLGSYKSHEDLPESFKKNPLVLIDVDLVYEYGGKLTPPDDFQIKITMDDAIANYENAKKYIKK